MSASVEDVDDLRDARLWQALAYAPDQNVAPDWRLRKAILKRAGDAIGALDPDEAEAALELAARPWWRIGPAGGERSRMPWIAAFTTVLVAALLTMFWRREPVVAPQRDAEPMVAAPTPTPAPQARESNAPAPSSPPEPRPSRSSASSQASSSAPASTPSSAPPSTALLEPPPVPIAAPNPPVASVAQPPAVKAQKTPPPTTPSPSPPRRESVEAAVKPAPPAVSAVPPQAAPEVARAAPSPSVRTEATEPPTFSALSQWSRMTITRRGGESRSLQRAEGRDLNALLGSAAISAVGPQPLRGAPEYRVTLERNGEVLAVFDVASNQVRWREGKSPAATGVPSAPALSALREALRETVQQEPMATPGNAPPRNP
jgi:hypothetical protein